MARPRGVRLAANFERNLEEIRSFLAERDGDDTFARLVDRLAAEVIPTLERFPGVGADFLARAPLSEKGLIAFEGLAKAIGPDAQVRQWIEGDYVILYLVRGPTVTLLSIKHHRQLSFDLPAHWP